LILISRNPPTCTLRLPSLPSVVLRIKFPNAYPDEAPIVDGTETIGEDVPKGAGAVIVGLAQTTLSRVWTPGAPCIFDLIEELGADIESNKNHEPYQAITLHNGPEPQFNDKEKEGRPDREDASMDILDTVPPWIVTVPITEKKSVFIGRAAPVSSPAQARQYLHHLFATDKKVAKATHNITAWRIHGPNETNYQDCDDDGETAAGGRVLHLMQLMDVWNVMVVVTRWYGGILLGPDRFRIINQAAREALVSGRFVQVTDGGKKKSKR
jgi:Uncharacterized protein family UPF0029/RWD domain